MIKIIDNFSSMLNKFNFRLIQKTKELSFLNQLNKTLLSQTRLKGIVRLSFTQVINFLRARAGLILLLDEQGDIIAMAPGQIVNTRALEIIKEKCKESFFVTNLVRRALKRKKAIIFRQQGILESLKDCWGIKENLDDQIVVYVPLWSKDNIAGMMFFYFSGKKFTRIIKKSLLVKVGEQLMLAIEKAKLFEQMKKRMEQFSALYSMSHLINRRLALEEILTKSLPFLANMFEADKAWVMLYQDGKLIIKEPYIGLAQEEVQSLTRLTDKQLEFSLAVLESGQVLLLNNPPHGEPFPNSFGVEMENILLLPLKMQSTHIGLIYVANSKKGKFTLLESQLATSVAIQLNGVWERGKLQEKLAEENAKLEMANRLKSQFLANMSHELRTPMNSIIGYTSCILDGMDGEINEEQKKDLRKILDSAEHLLQLINDILDISKIEAGKTDLKIGPFNLLPCIDGALVTLEKLAHDKGLAITKELPCCLPFVLGDPSRVRQILLNLLSNAIKFTHQGSINIKVRKMSKYVEIQIKDTGIGIDSQALSYIFEEFRQADGSTTRKYGGTGLGLAITRKLVELQKGRIWVDSQLGKGSRFTFLLPTTSEQEMNCKKCVKKGSD